MNTTRQKTIATDGFRLIELLVVIAMSPAGCFLALKRRAILKMSLRDKGIWWPPFPARKQPDSPVMPSRPFRRSVSRHEDEGHDHAYGVQRKKCGTCSGLGERVNHPLRGGQSRRVDFPLPDERCSLCLRERARVRGNGANYHPAYQTIAGSWLVFALPGRLI